MSWHVEINTPFIIGVGCRVLLLQDAGLSEKKDPYMGEHWIERIVDKTEEHPFQILIEDEDGHISSVDDWSRLCHIGSDHKKCKGEH